MQKAEARRLKDVPIEAEMANDARVIATTSL
jgi:hypothetical protein